MHTNGPNSEPFENLRLELRRGCLVVAVLLQLRTELYGYAICNALNYKGLAIDGKYPVSAPPQAGKPGTPGQSVAGTGQAQQALLSPIARG